MYTHHERRSCRLQDVLAIPDTTIFLGVDVDEERRLVGRTWEPGKGEFRDDHGFACGPVEFCVRRFEVSIPVVIIDGIDVEVRGQCFEKFDVWDTLVADAKNEVMGIEGTDHGRIPSIICHRNFGPPGVQKPLPHGQRVRFRRRGSSDAFEVRVRRPPLVI
jgi:hypothetical protein